MSNDQICPIWGTPAEIISHPSQCNGGGGYDVISPRAGGKYWIAGIVLDNLGNSDIQTKVNLTNWIVEQNNLGTIPKIQIETLQKLNNQPKTSLLERQDRILRFLEKKSEHISEIHEFDLADGEILIHQGISLNSVDPKSFELMAWSCSYKHSELEYLLAYLIELEYIVVQDLSAIGGGYSCRIEPKGYARLTELDGANLESSQVFIAMWFDDSMKNAYEKGIEPAIYDSGYKPMLINQKQHIGKIDDQIIAEIRRSRFLVADFTAGEKDCGKDETIHVPRGGVYYEAGFAQGLNIPVIWTCKKDQMERIHFDTRQFNHINWENEEDLYEQLKNRIGAVIGDGPIQNKQNVE